MDLLNVDCRLISYDGNRFSYDKKPFKIVMKKVYCVFRLDNDMRCHDLTCSLTNTFRFHISYLDKLDEIYERMKELSWWPIIEGVYYYFSGSYYILRCYYDRNIFRHQLIDDREKSFPFSKWKDNSGHAVRKELHILADLSDPLVIKSFCSGKMIPRINILSGISDDLIKPKS